MENEGERIKSSDEGEFKVKALGVCQYGGRPTEQVVTAGTSGHGARDTKAICGPVVRPEGPCRLAASDLAQAAAIPLQTSPQSPNYVCQTQAVGHSGSANCSSSTALSSRWKTCMGTHLSRGHPPTRGAWGCCGMISMTLWLPGTGNRQRYNVAC